MCKQFCNLCGIEEFSNPESLKGRQENTDFDYLHYTYHHGVFLNYYLLVVVALTRESPFSLRFLSFSCLLLVAGSCPDASSFTKDGDPLPSTKGEMTPVQSLKTAKRGIC